MLELKEEFADWKNEYNRKHNENVNRLNVMEKRLIQKEENLDKRYSNLDNKEKELKKKERDLDIQEEETAALKNSVNKLYEEQRLKLEKISGLTVQEAKELIIKQYEGEARLESAQKLKLIDEELKSKSQQMAKDVISNAVQRIATEHVVSSSVTVIDLPSDEMKGRIIGREGRNIRALENATGVDFIVDDTPEAILVSSFDPIRREIAKQTIQTLIADGRIHPARIEEIVDRIKGNFDTYLRREGETAVLELGIKDINPELYFYLGKLKFRSSFGQNVLEHSKDVAMIAAMLAREIGANVNICKRAGLLHDIGKAIDRETEGTHTSLSVDLTKKYGESAAVQDAIASHHMDTEFHFHRSRPDPGRGQHLRRPARRQARDPGDLHQAPGKAGGAEQVVCRRDQGLRPAGRARDPGHRQRQRAGRQPHLPDLQGHRQEDPGRDGVSRADQGFGDPGSPGHRICQVNRCGSS